MISAIMVIVLVLTIIVAVLYFGYMSGRGMCKWTQKDGFMWNTLKYIANSFLFGVPGVLVYLS